MDDFKLPVTAHDFDVCNLHLIQHRSARLRSYTAPCGHPCRTHCTDLRTIVRGRSSVAGTNALVQSSPIPIITPSNEISCVQILSPSVQLLLLHRNCKHYRLFRVPRLFDSHKAQIPYPATYSFLVIRSPFRSIPTNAKMYHLEGNTSTHTSTGASDDSTPLLAALYTNIKTRWQAGASATAATTKAQQIGSLREISVRPQISRSATQDSVQEKPQ